MWNCASKQNGFNMLRCGRHAEAQKSRIHIPFGRAESVVFLFSVVHPRSCHTFERKRDCVFFGTNSNSIWHSSRGAQRDLYE